MTHRWRIESEDDLRLAWELLNEHDENQEYVRELKADIRRWNRLCNSNDLARYIKISDDGSWAVRRVICGKVIKSEKEARAKYENRYRRDWRPSPYDCTGQEQTDLLKITKRGNRYVLYYSVSLDV